MKFLPAVLLSLAVAGSTENAMIEASPTYLDPDSECGDRHVDIYDKLIDAFGEEYCTTEEREVFGMDNLWTVCTDIKAGHFQYEVFYYYFYEPDEPHIIDVWDWGEGVGSIGVHYLDFKYPNPGIERLSNDNTCVEKAEDGKIVKTLEAIKTRHCRNNHQPFQASDGTETSCSEIGSLSRKQRNRNCRDDIVAEKCPGICNKEDCGCFDNQFPFSNGKQSCEILAGYGPKKRDRKCSKKKYKMHCPSICDEECSA